MPRKKATEDFTLSDMGDFIRDKLLTVSELPNMYHYKPHPKQVMFHESPKKGRLYIGGNRSGKSTAGVMEDIWWLTKKHPSLKMPHRPIRGRAVVSDFMSGWVSILQPIFAQWLPPSELINGSWEDSWSNAERKLTLANKSFIEVKSNDQDLVKHAGTSRDFIHFDEEPPSDKFKENLLRIVDTAGSWWMTMTPVDGLTWVYSDLYEPYQDGNEERDFEIIEVDMDENPYLTNEQKETVLGFLDDDEREIRKKGKFVQKGGLVYPEYSYDTHSREPLKFIPAGWAVYMSTDHGFNNPTAHLWHAVSPGMTQIITFDEIYLSGLTVKESARMVREKESQWGIQPFLRTGDPAMKQSTAATGMSIAMQYAVEESMYYALDSIPRQVSIGVDRITQYLKTNTQTGKPFWQITTNCANLHKEMRKLHWKTYETSKQNDKNNLREEIHKKDDHACDSARYFFTLMPDLSPENVGIKEPRLLVGDTSMPQNYVDTLVEMAHSQQSRRPVNTYWRGRQGVRTATLPIGGDTFGFEDED